MQARNWWWVAGALAAAVIATITTLALTGAADPTLLSDSGTIVRWGRPVITVAVDIASAVTIGGSMLLVFVLPRSHASWERVRILVMSAAPLWTIAIAAQIVFSYAATAGRPLGSAGFMDELLYYVTELGAGRARLTTLILAALTAVVAAAIAGYGTALATWVMSLAVIIPVAVTGHAAGAENHDLAMNAAFIHIIGAGLWMGGLLCLIAAFGLLQRPGNDRPRADDPSAVHPSAGRAGRAGRRGPQPVDLAAVATRYSAIAAWAFAGVAVSGIANAWVRIGEFANLATPYGWTVIGKSTALVLLGVAGWWHRRYTINQLPTAPKKFWRLAGVELLVMGAAMGMAVVLASTATPKPQEPVDAPSPTMILSKRPEPIPPTFERWFTEFFPDLLFAFVAAAMVIVYVTWVIRLHRRGDAWPVHRTVLWVIAALVFAYLNLGGPAVYGHVLLSAHMLGHMAMVLIIPILIVLSAPVTLAMRALPARKDGSRGPREWLLLFVHSKWANFWSHPLIAAGNLIASMLLFYFTPLIVFAMTTHIGHVLMVVHFTLVGYLFINVIIGIDPSATRPSYPLRLVLMFATMIFHAFFGVAIISMTGLIGAPFFGQLGLSWGVDAALDQRIAGEITWGVGEIPSLALAISLAVMWAKSEERVARRVDRAADRDGDADLKAYNAMLAELATDDAPGHPADSPAPEDSPAPGEPQARERGAAQERT